MTGQRNEDKSFGEQHWRFDKRISFDTIGALLGVVLIIGLPMYSTFRNMESRLLTNELLLQEMVKMNVQREVDRKIERAESTQQVKEFSDQITLLRIATGQLTAQLQQRR